MVLMGKYATGDKFERKCNYQKVWEDLKLAAVEGKIVVGLVFLSKDWLKLRFHE